MPGTSGGLKAVGDSLLSESVVYDMLKDRMSWTTRWTGDVTRMWTVLRLRIEWI